MLHALDLRADSGTIIERHRRRPDACLYCSNSAASVEHVVPEAIGGRLTAPILCADHNAAVNAVADEPLSEAFAPYVTFMQIARHRGQVGATYPGIDQDGKTVYVMPGGLARREPLDVLARDENKRILRAEGDLSKLESLPDAAFANVETRYELAKITVPDVTVAIGTGRGTMNAALKIALHFYAGFIDDVARDVACRLLAFIEGAEGIQEFVRTPLLEAEIFPDIGEPQHEVTCYADDGATLVTVLLFGMYGYACRLPLECANSGLRYRQVLSQAYPQFFEGVPRPSALDWNKRPNDAEEWAGKMEGRRVRLFQPGIQLGFRARCRRAYERAVSESSNYGSLLERYGYALQIEAFSAEDVAVFVEIARRRMQRDLVPWECEVEILEDGRIAVK